MHPSLTAKWVPPADLEPKRRMGRNEMCWCGSGKKWKSCHRDRHLQGEEPLGRVLQRFHAAQKMGVCLYPRSVSESCSTRPIKAHTIQRRGGLAAIAENGHVISAKRGYEKIFKNEGQLVPEEVGIANASTFMGFCAGHDNELFEPIEKNDFQLDHRAAFLLAYRAIAYEYLTKANALEAVEIQRGMDQGKDFDTQVHIQQYLHV